MGEEELEEAAELDVEELKEFEREREDILLKLDRLEEKREEFKKAVYDKVKGDYEKRLEGLSARLEKKRRVISAEIMRLKDEKAELGRQCDMIRDELEELDLRHAIEEFDDAAYESKASAKKDSLKGAEECLRETEAQLEFLGGLIGEPVAEEAEVAAPVGEKEEAEKEEAEKEKAEEEKVEEREAEKEEEVVAEKEEEAVGEKEESEEEEAEKEETPEEVPLRPTSAPPGVIKREEFEVERGVEPEPVEAEAKTEEAAVGDAGEEPTLICPKCGASNRPDSWYCEKCGAELMGSAEPASPPK
jgi:hypothetical protein